MLRSAALYLPSLLVPRVAAFAILLFGSNLLSAEEFGYFSLVIIIGEASEMTATNWVRIAVIKFTGTHGKLRRAFAIQMGRVVLLTTVAGILVASAVVFTISPEAALPVGAATATYVAANALLRYGLTLNQVLEKRASYAGIEVARSIVGLTAAASAMYTTRSFLPASIVGSLVTAAAGAYAVGSALHATSSQDRARVKISDLTAYATPLVLLTFATYCVTSLDKLLIKAIHDAQTFAMYAAVFAVSRQGFDIVAAAFNLGGFARLSKLQEHARITEAQSLLSTQMAYILAVALPSAGLLIGAREHISALLFPLPYLNTFVTAAPFIAIGAIVLNIKSFVYDNIFHLRARNLRQLPTVTIGALASLIVGSIVIPWRADLGAALMFLTGAIVTLCLSVWLSADLLRIPVAWKSVSTSGGIGLCVCGIAAWLTRVDRVELSEAALLAALGATNCASVFCALALARISQRRQVLRPSLLSTLVS